MTNYEVYCVRTSKDKVYGKQHMLVPLSQYITQKVSVSNRAGSKGRALACKYRVSGLLTTLQLEFQFTLKGHT